MTKKNRNKKMANPKLGALGEFPQGKIDETDEGALRIAVGRDLLNGVVRIDFGTRVTWLGMDIETASEFAAAIIRACMEIKIAHAKRGKA